ncbi:hypothetical protein MRX96_002355 [Rhipicephalus microplus]
MQELFNPTHDESTSEVNGDPDEPHQPREEVQWKIMRIALERALPRISASTATGLNGIPAGLVKCLGKSAREHLAGIFNTILKNGPIPPDWQCGRVPGLFANILGCLEIKFRCCSLCGLQVCYLIKLPRRLRL